MKETNSITLKFPVKSFRKIPNPELNSKNSGEAKPEMYQLIADVKDIPEGIPMDTNPRNQNLNTKVAKKIKESLINHVNKNFYLLNRGILLSAASINYDNVNSVVSITFEDTSVHGNVDGGHTYKVILENRDQLEVNEQYVRIEVLTGIEDMFESVAASRNTSFQVSDKSIANLEDKFSIIKNAIKTEAFSNNINYKENDIYKIDIQDMLSIFYMFNINRFPQGSTTYPVSAYSSKKACLDQYLSDYNRFAETCDNPYVKMASIMPDICRLYDKIESGMAEFYKGEGEDIKKYGRIIGVAMAKGGKKFHSKYNEMQMDYASPNGFILPILGSFRALVTEKDGKYIWVKDPFEVLEKVGSTLVNRTIDMSRQLGNNPNATGKSTSLWELLYMQVLVRGAASL